MVYDIQILTGTRPYQDLSKNIQNFFKKCHYIIFDDAITFFEK